MPDAWRIVLDHDAIKVLGKLPRELRERIRRVVDGLAEDPRPNGCKKLRGYRNLYRLRVGDWRITYAIKDEMLVILVIEIAPRGSAYRSLER